MYNKYNDHYLQLEQAKKKQRYSLMDRAKKEELLETCAKKYKEIDVSKRNKCLKIEETSIIIIIIIIFIQGAFSH